MEARSGATTMTVRNTGFRRQKLPQTNTVAREGVGARSGATTTTVRNKGFRSQSQPKPHRSKEREGQERSDDYDGAQ